MIKSLKENLLFLFTLSLVSSYFFSMGYYFHFSLDISTFLSIQDLILIFAKWIWIIGIYVVLVVIMIRNLFKENGIRESWWNKTIGKTSIKRRGLVFIPLFIFLIVLSIIYKQIGYTLLGLFIIFIVIIGIKEMIKQLNNSLKHKKVLAKLEFQDWILISMLSIIFFVGIPLISGNGLARNSTTDNLLVRFDDGAFINTSDSVNIIYIGKTADYFFLYNTKKRSSTTYVMSKVKSFEVISKTK